MHLSWVILQQAQYARPFLKRFKERAREVWIIGLSVWLLAAMGLPSAVVAQSPVFVSSSALEAEYLVNTMRDFGTLPSVGERAPMRTMTVPATAYTSDPWETDDTPFITASGSHVRHGIIAANFLPMGTQVRIPEFYGDQIFVVEDRMNRRYHERIDIWMEEKQEARNFGIRYVTIEIF